jgi:hypothetical protein
MKICWNNIENIRLTRNGNFRDIITKRIYYYKECNKCGESFLGTYKKCKFCCQHCAQGAENNPMYGKHISQKQKDIISKNNTERIVTNETRKKISNSSKRFKKEKNPAWKGGVTEKKIPLYDTYASQIDWCEEVRRNDNDLNILEVRCTYCGKWFVPTYINVSNRVQSLKCNVSGEYRFYCSKACKKACPLYHKTPETLMKEDAVRAGRLSWLELDREVQHELRQMVLERDNHTCRNCGATDKPLHCHHIEPVAINPIESADIDNCMTLCIDCHKQAHQKDGCRTGQLKECM